MVDPLSTRIVGKPVVFNHNHATDIQLIISLISEIANVADNLDSLNSVLDTIEERADQIRAQLLELLTSNREIRQSLKEENEKNQGHCQKSSEQNPDSISKRDSDAEPSHDE